MTKNNDEIASKIRTLLLAATPGEPWKHVTCEDGWQFVGTDGQIICHQDPNYSRTGEVGEGRWDDAATRGWFAFIVEAHNQMSALLDERDALRGALPDPGKLELLAAWFEKHDDDLGIEGEDEVQRELWAWAAGIRAALKETPR